VVEAANVVAGFNFANRVADALAVAREVPPFFQRRRSTRHGIMWLLSRGVRARMNFENRSPAPIRSGDVIRRLEHALRRADLGALPSYFDWLRIRPYVLAGQAAICESLITESGLERRTLLRAGHLVAELNGDIECAGTFGALLHSSGWTPEPESKVEAEILAFIRDITLRAEEIDDEQVDSLRTRCGLSDRDILDVVLVAAAQNAGTRLNRAYRGSTAGAELEQGAA
jgi:hypothetical protein